MGLPPIIVNVLLTLVNIIVVYFAAFRFRLNWPTIVGVMVITNMVIDIFVKLLGSKKAKTDREAASVLAGAMETLIFWVITSIAVLVILSMRFGFPMALGIAIIVSLVGGALRALLR